MEVEGEEVWAGAGQSKDRQEGSTGHRHERARAGMEVWSKAV